MATSRTASSAERPSRREREQAFRSQLVLEAAEAVFAEHGFEGASVESIAAKAEVAIATLYKLFGSKEAVFGALVEWRQDEFLLEVQTLASEDVAPPERLQRLIEGIFRYFEVHGSTFRIYLGASHGFPWRIRASFGDRAFEKYTQFLEFLAERLRDGMHSRDWPQGDSQRLAVAIMGGINSLLTHRHTRNPRPALDEDIAFAVSFAHRVIAATAGSLRRK